MILKLSELEIARPFKYPFDDGPNHNFRSEIHAESIGILIKASNSK